MYSKYKVNFLTKDQIALQTNIWLCCLKGGPRYKGGLLEVLFGVISFVYPSLISIIILIESISTLFVLFDGQN